MNIEITKVLVLAREHSMDKLIITTTMPSTVYPWDEPAHLVLDVAKGSGVQYVRDNFNMEPEVIQV